MERLENAAFPALFPPMSSVTSRRGMLTSWSRLKRRIVTDLMVLMRALPLLVSA
jgi:hypothetical protein